MKSTADQFIKELDEKFDALPPNEKRRLRATISQRENRMFSNEWDDFTDSMKYIFLEYIDDLLRPTVAVSQKIRWKGILIVFVPNLYVSKYTEIWLLEAVLGSSVVRERLDEKHILDDDFVEQLFRQAPYFFYLNQAETWLFSDYNDLSEAEGGPLKQLTAFDSLQRFGLKLLEEAKEKQYVRL